MLTQHRTDRRTSKSVEVRLSALHILQRPHSPEQTSPTRMLQCGADWLA